MTPLVVGSPGPAHGADLRLYTLQDLRALPPAVEQVEGLIAAQSVVSLVGPSGVGKTFVALDLALAIALGRPFHGRAVQQSAVVYITAEGQQTLINRIDAALHAWGCETDPPLWVMRHVFDLMNPAEVEALCCAIEAAAIHPGIIVIDPLASYAAGSTDRMADVAAVNRHGLIPLRERLRSTVLLVVHAGWEGKRERGSSHLRDIMDTSISVTAKGDGIRVECLTQRDLEPFPPIALTLQPVPTPAPRGGTTCVVVDGSAAAADAVPDVAALPEKTRHAYDVLATSAAELRFTEWETACQLSPSTFKAARQRLVASGLVVEHDGRYRVNVVEQPGVGNTSATPAAEVSHVG